MKKFSNTIWMCGMGTSLGSMALALIFLFSTSCSADDGLAPAPQQPTFDAFVIEQFGSTADDTEPVPINDRSFTFGTDATAFDDLLQ